MARTLYARGAVNQAVGFSGLDYEKSADWASAGAGSLVFSGHTTGTAKVATYTSLDQAHNASDWPVTGTVGSWSMDVTATSNTASTGNIVQLRRLSSNTNTSLGQSGNGAPNFSTTGIKTGTVADFSLNGNAGRAVTDIASIYVVVYGSSSHSSGSMTLDDSDTFMSLANFNAPTTDPRVINRSPSVLQAVSRAANW